MAKHNTILERTGALIIDILILIPIGIIVISSQNELLGNTSTIYTFQVAIGLICICYFVAFNTTKGQTIGKKICGVRVVDMSENNITLYQAIIRILPSVFILLGLVLIQASSTSPKNSFNQLLLLYGDITLLTLIFLWSVANFIVMTANVKDRAIQDFLAKTIVIK